MSYSLVGKFYTKVALYEMELSEITQVLTLPIYTLVVHVNNASLPFDFFHIFINCFISEVSD